MNMFEFDISSEVQQLITRYRAKINLTHPLEQIQTLDIRQIFGQVDQYIFK